MVEPRFEQSARQVSARNLTENVAAVAATWNAATGHMHIIYYLVGPPADEDESLRELTLAELLHGYPRIRSATVAFGDVKDLDAGARGDLAFRRD